ncbi:FeoB-associated Cys-rich membrane protein [uncultured Pseudodesulfovibrio sp.]|uniref:FeoB-associated Cys-rich membrane protein n=1 Tax=uncultured Pseudodesulfovibrio sp. TaxID=2035858 RepID=UPI0029C705AC|nr:FeoB-associated Cys-rich membrane protein [uncultured Pseudodesulfovibrio sp.]
MFDTVIVVAIVAIAAFFVGRRLYRSFTAKQSGCGCGGCGQSCGCSDIADSPGKNNCCGSR